MELSRRQLLRAAGVGVGAAAGAALVPSLLPDTAYAAGLDYKALGRKLSGPLIMPGSKDYAGARRSYNPLFDGRKPAAVARCVSPADVQACVRAAADSTTPIAARGGGHSYAGYSTPNGALVVDTRPLSKITVHNDHTVRIGAGAQLGNVYAALAKAGRALPAGSCPTVGIGGLTLGGGVGVLTRQYGLTCDHLVSADIVTADGRLRTVSAKNDPELFWALRGGGGGNLGIVTALTFRTVPAPRLGVYSLSFPAGSAAEVFGAWQDWLPGSPRELWSKCSLSGGSPVSVRLSACYVGDAAKGQAALHKLVTRAGVKPSHVDIQQLGFGAAMDYFAGSGGRESFVASSRTLDHRVSAPEKVAALVGNRTGMDVMFDALGGAVHDVAAGDTAFAHRGSLATVQVYHACTGATAASARRSVNAVRDGLAPLVGSGAYANYIDPQLPHWAQAYYGGNLARLTAAAKRYDPHGVFHFAQSIPR